jgi:predicted  nucleic acid-binding Zn-ribbon protein
MAANWEKDCILYEDRVEQKFSRPLEGAKMMKTKRTTDRRNQIKVMLELYKLENQGDRHEKTDAYDRLEKKLDPSLLRRYQKLIERKGTGVAVMKNRVCSGCKMVYPETHEMLRYRNFIHSCEYCGRFLVVTDKSA